MADVFSSIGQWLFAFLGWSARPSNQYPTFSKIDRVGVARYVTIDAVRWLNIPVNRFDLDDSKADRLGLVRAIYEALAKCGIRYVTEVYQSSTSTQVVRTPGAMFEHPKEGTCLDLATLFSGVALASGLLPIIVVCKGHAFALVSVSDALERWNRLGRKGLPLFKEALTTDRSGLLALVETGDLVPIECTGFAYSARFENISQSPYPEVQGRENGLLSFQDSINAGKKQFYLSTREFQYAVDIASAHFQWDIRPYGIPQLPQQITADRAHALSRIIMGLSLFVIFSAYLMFAFLDSADAVANRLEGQVLSDMSVSQFSRSLLDYSTLVKRTVDSRLSRRITESQEVIDLSEQVRLANQQSRAYLWRWLYSGTYPQRGLSEPTSLMELTTRSTLIHQIPQAHLPAETLWNAFKHAKSTASERQALLLSLGDCDVASFDLNHKACSVFAEISTAFEKDDDPGVHAAAWWLLANRFEIKGGEELAKVQSRLMKAGMGRLSDNPLSKPTWYVEATCGITMIVIPDGRQFTMGNNMPTLGPADEAAEQRLSPIPHRVTIPRLFAISMTEITEKQFEMSEITPKDKSYGGDFARTSPWEHAAQYCNWLSRQQRLSECYEAVKDSSPVYMSDYSGIRHTPVSYHLEQEGYRLPTESEWEFAAKGCIGDMPSLLYSCGNDFNLLRGYASFTGFREKVATKRPNGLGLFDCHGGLSELCDDNASPYRDSDRNRAIEDVGVKIDYTQELGKMRIVRGGNFSSGSPSRSLTVFRREEWGQRVPSNKNGFRIARTIESLPQSLKP